MMQNHQIIGTPASELANFISTMMSLTTNELNCLVSSDHQFVQLMREVNDRVMKFRQQQQQSLDHQQQQLLLQMQLNEAMANGQQFPQSQFGHSNNNYGQISNSNANSNNGSLNNINSSLTTTGTNLSTSSDANLDGNCNQVNGLNGNDLTALDLRNIGQTAPQATNLYATNSATNILALWPTHFNIASAQPTQQHQTVTDLQLQAAIQAGQYSQLINGLLTNSNSVAFAISDQQQQQHNSSDFAAVMLAAAASQQHQHQQQNSTNCVQLSNSRPLIQSQNQFNIDEALNQSKNSGMNHVQEGDEKTNSIQKQQAGWNNSTNLSNLNGVDMQMMNNNKSKKLVTNSRTKKSNENKFSSQCLDSKSHLNDPNLNQNFSNSNGQLYLSNGGVTMLNFQNKLSNSPILNENSEICEIPNKKFKPHSQQSPLSKHDQQQKLSNKGSNNLKKQNSSLQNENCNVTNSINTNINLTNLASKLINNTTQYNQLNGHQHNLIVNHANVNYPNGNEKINKSPSSLDSPDSSQNNNGVNKRHKGEFDEPSFVEVERRRVELETPANYHTLSLTSGSCACILGSRFQTRTPSEVLRMVNEWKNLSAQERLQHKWDAADLPRDIPLAEISKFELLRKEASGGMANFGGTSKRKPLGIRGTRQFLLILYCLWGHPGSQDRMQREGYCPHCFAKIKKPNDQSTLVRVVNHFNMKHRQGHNPHLSPVSIATDSSSQIGNESSFSTPSSTPTSSLNNSSLILSTVNSNFNSTSTGGFSVTNQNHKTLDESIHSETGSTPLNSNLSHSNAQLQHVKFPGSYNNINGDIRSLQNESASSQLTVTIGESPLIESESIKVEKSSQGCITQTEKGEEDCATSVDLMKLNVTKSDGLSDNNFKNIMDETERKVESTIFSEYNNQEKKIIVEPKHNSDANIEIAVDNGNGERRTRRNDDDKNENETKASSIGNDINITDKEGTIKPKLSSLLVEGVYESFNNRQSVGENLIATTVKLLNENDCKVECKDTQDAIQNDDANEIKLADQSKANNAQSQSKGEQTVVPPTTLQQQFECAENLTVEHTKVLQVNFISEEYANIEANEKHSEHSQQRSNNNLDKPNCELQQQDCDNSPQLQKQKGHYERRDKKPQTEQQQNADDEHEQSALVISIAFENEEEQASDEHEHHPKLMTMVQTEAPTCNSVSIS